MAARQQSVSVDPERWYRDEYGEPPTYSGLLNELAKTPLERQHLLRPYFEPTPEDLEEGRKQPTPAHRAIATLMSQGFIRVVITTNFDRLLETALVDRGVVATVLSSEDDVEGALPLVHLKHCVFKVHGDYMDPTTLNAPDELESYPGAYDEFLGRIFSEFGLLVSGWSADWDVALRRALSRAPSRRFTTYWSTRSEVSDEAQKLITQRQAQLVQVTDADSLFQRLEERVTAIEAFSRPHPTDH